MVFLNMAENNKVLQNYKQEIWSKEMDTFDLVQASLQVFSCEG